MDALSRRAVRRLALARAGLLKPEWTGLAQRASGSGERARTAALRVISRFGYIQLDTVSVAGARSHGIVLMSRLEGFEPALAEKLLQPGVPLFEYWGHEASWMPLELYPLFEFRRREYQVHPWYGDVLGEHPELARELLERVRAEGPLRAAEMDGGGTGWWQMQPVKKVALALWSSGELAIRERCNFLRTYDLVERVIPEELRGRRISVQRAYRELLERALVGHGWASTATLAATWRLKRSDGEVDRALTGLAELGRVVACEVEGGGAGWIRPEDLELAARLERCRLRRDRGVLLSPFDPVLWDRERVQQLFGFHQVLEIYKPAAQRLYGYYCLPVLGGEELVARVDLKADRRHGRLELKALHYEAERPSAAARQAVDTALERYSSALQLKLQ